MPLLLEIMSVEAGNCFADDSEFTWISDEIFSFNDSVGVLRMSTENFAGYRYWANDILSISPISFRTDQLWGGQSKITGAGSIEIAMDAFPDDWWFPASSYPFRLSVTDALEDTAIEILSGTLIRNEINPPKSISFDTYPISLDANLLSITTDYDGNVVTLPMAFGNVSYVTPVRLPDAIGGNRRYSAGGITGWLHTYAGGGLPVWHVFDDGVDICTNATAISANVFELTVTPVGTVTISGKGADSEINSLFALICGTGWLSLSFYHFDLSPTFLMINRWVTSQIKAIDFLGEAAAAVQYYFYILGGCLNLYPMDKGLDYSTIDIATDALYGTVYSQPVPTKLIKHNWTSRLAVEETIGLYVKETAEEISATSYILGGQLWNFGSEVAVDVYTDIRADISVRLDFILRYSNSLRFTINLPLSATELRPGDLLEIIDNRFPEGTIIYPSAYRWSAHARDIIYDFIGKKITIEGEYSVFGEY